MHLSVKTISTHKARAMAKLGCKSLSDMVHYAISKNLKEECEARSNGW
jgi:DNA-binding CsgD family transcriptional regulator